MPKAKKPSQSGIADALDTDEQMIQKKAKQEAQEKTQEKAQIKQGASKEPERKKEILKKPVMNPVGRPKKKGSKRQGVADGTHVNLNIIIPLNLHEELGLEAFKNKEKDMSDIITGLLQKHYKK